MDVRLPDGTIVKNVPEGMTQAQLMERMNRPPVAAAPAPQPSRWQQVKDMLASSSGAPIAGGPLNMLFGESMKSFDESVKKGAYEAGGAATDVAARSGLSPEVAGGVGFAANVGVQALPTLVGTLAGKMVQPITRNAPLLGGRALMQSALKPGSKDLASGDAAKAIDTMLEGGFSATPAGVAKMRSLVKALGQQVDDMIKASPATVDKNIAKREVLDKLAEFRKQVNPSADAKTILNSWNEFKRTTGQDIPVQLAQELKKGTYRILADKYAHMGTVGDEAGTQAQMALARGLRKGIEQQVPGVVAPNKKAQELINAIEIAERRAGVAGNRDIAGIAWLAENPAAAGGMLADRSPWLKSLAARLMYSGTPAAGAVAGTAYPIADELARSR